MSNTWTIRCIVLSVTLLGYECFDDTVIAEEPKSRGRALLVGCTKYDHLAPSRHLQGPGNDVLLMRDLMIERFGFSKDQIVILAESEGMPQLRPIRENIEREFQKLGREAIAGEQVLIFLAGHGSQQPELNPSLDDPEPDGLDEIFLPADVKGWDGSVGRVPNAIIDDEIHTWLAAIEKRKAAVTIIMDSCHSGTMTRGLDERTRELPPGTLVPTAVIQKALDQAANRSSTGEKTRGGRRPEVGFDVPAVVAIYAAQSSELTVEKLLPNEGADRKPYGLLTYTMNQILTRSTRPLTYRELVRQIQTQYVGMGRTFPTPMIEGQNRDREVFGMSVWPDRSRIRLTKTGRGLTINAGILQGVTQDSVLAVYRESDDVDKVTEKPLGYVRIQLARTVDSDVIPCEFEGQAAVKDLPQGARCEVAFVDAGDLQLRFSVQADGPGADLAWVKRLQTELRSTSPAGMKLRLVRLTDNEADAHWIVRVRKHDVILIPAESVVTDSNSIPPTAFGPKPLDAATVEWIGGALSRIARAANLKKLATSESEEAPRFDAVRCELGIERADTHQRGTSERLNLYHGETMTIRVKNPCRFPVDVTLLSIDAAHGIQPLFPEHGEVNRLQPGESVPVQTEIVAEMRGLEHLVAIVMKAEGEVVDFTILAQPSLEVFKTRGGNDRSLETPLGALLKHAVFAEGQTRGVKRTAVKGHRLQLLTWEVQPEQQP